MLSMSKIRRCISDAHNQSCTASHRSNQRRNSFVSEPMVDIPRESLPELFQGPRYHIPGLNPALSLVQRDGFLLPVGLDGRCCKSSGTNLHFAGTFCSGFRFPKKKNNTGIPTPPAVSCSTSDNTTCRSFRWGFVGSVELSSVAKRKRQLLVSHSGSRAKILTATANNFHDAKRGQSSAGVEILIFSSFAGKHKHFLHSSHAADKNRQRTGTVP
jgi:hypothetical protein